jgi:hypothetical protein
MDPRSPATTEVLSQQLRLGRQIFGDALEAQRAVSELRFVEKQLAGSQTKAGLKAPLTEAKAALLRIGEGSEGAPGLQDAYRDLVSALQVVEGGDRAVPSQAIAVYEESNQHAKKRLQEWAAFKRTTLARLNERLREEHGAPISVGGEGP